MLCPNCLIKKVTVKVVCFGICHTDSKLTLGVKKKITHAGKFIGGVWKTCLKKYENKKKQTI